MSLAKRLLHALIVVIVLVVGAAAAAIVVSQTAWFKDWLRGYIVRDAHRYLNGDLTIGRLGGNLFFGVELESIDVSIDGVSVVAIQDAGLKYNFFELITKGASIDELRLNRPVIHLRRDGDTWSLLRLIKEQEREADREGPASPITVEGIRISDGSIFVETPLDSSRVDVPDLIDKIDARLFFQYEPVRYSIGIDHVSFRTQDPAVAFNALSGVVSVHDDTLSLDRLALRTEESSISVAGGVSHYLTKPVLQLEISSDGVSVPEVARFVPALARIQLQPAFELRLDGPLDRLGVGLNVRSSGGQLAGQLTVDLAAPGQAVTGDLAIRHVDLAAVMPSQPASDVSADLHAEVSGETLADVRGLTGAASLRTGRIEVAGFAPDRIIADARMADGSVAISASAQAYGVSATAVGRAALPPRSNSNDPIAYALSGDIRRIDLRRLPPALGAPSVDTDITLAYQVSGREPWPVGDRSAAPRGRTAAAEATFDDSSVAGSRIRKGSVARASLKDRDVSYAADATVTDVDLSRIGEAFSLPALQHEKYRSSLNGHVAAEGRGMTLSRLQLTASGELTESSVLGGTIPHATFEAWVADDRARLTADGAFRRLDPAALSAYEAVKGELAGSIRVDATVSGLSAGVTPDNVAGDARLTLGPSSAGGLVIEAADADVRYADREGEVRRLEVVGRDLNVQASGVLALNDTGQSSLVVHGDTPRLQEIGRLFGTPVEGIATVDATITGNRTELQANGTLVGNGLKYAGNGALSVTADLSVRVPELVPERASGAATTEATFVSFAGQDINELMATTSYADREITFEATARQPERSLSAGGSVSLEPERREVTLRSLGLASRGVTLQLAPGAQPVFHYGSDRFAVEDLRLTSGEGLVSAAGTFGRSDDELNVTVSDVDLAVVDSLLLREPQLSGRFDASTTIAGTRDEPRATGTFSVEDGGFRHFRYDSLTGTLEYVPTRVTLDARLQQNATQWMTAKGQVPVALFGAAPQPMSSDSQPAGRNVDAVDLTVDSSPINLGLVQGFTSVLTGVQGTAEAHVRITGTTEDPRPEGRISIHDGAVSVASTGAVYSGIAADVDLQADRVRINATTLDNHDNALSLVGELALNERRVSDVQLYVNADDFKVVDNELGNVRIQTSLEIAGDVKGPRIQGYLGVTTGQVNLDNVLALVGTSPYPTNEEAPAETTNVGTADANEQQRSTGVYAASTVDVALSVPDDLVVKASSLQPAGSPISLGALNVTLGGDVRVSKAREDAVRFVGAVNTIRGTYDFQGRRFEILRDGAIRLVGLERFNPTLDLRTRRMVQGVEARVNVRGTLMQPQIELTSTPPLEQADILSLIVFNQPINQLGEDQRASLARTAQGLAAGAVADQLAQSIGNALNLDRFEIQVAPETGGGPELTLGQQLGEKVFVSVQQGIGDQSVTSFVLEYELYDWLRLQTNVLQGESTQQSLFRRNQGSGADLIFFFSY